MNQGSLYLSSLRGRMGDWAYYPCLMKLKDVAKRINIAREIHEAPQLSEWIQRQLKKHRIQEISEYLQNNDQRFFNSLIVGVYDGEPKWSGVTSLKSSEESFNIDDIQEEVIESIGILKLSGNEKLFALDGQHRLVGIRDAIEKDKGLGEDEITVIFIAHKTDERGKTRSRRLFTTLNKHAKAVSKADIIALDEDDTMAITVRELIRENPYFRDDRISYNPTADIPKNDTQCLTTIINLYDVLQILFMYKNKIKNKTQKDSKSQLVKERLSSDQLKSYYSFACAYFDCLKKNFTSLKEYWEANDYKSIAQRYRHDTGGNILFRPIGLKIVTRLTVQLCVNNELKFDEAIKSVSKIPLELKKEPYEKVIWNSVSNKMIMNEVLMKDLLLYMLRQNMDTEKLKHRYAKVLGHSPEKVTLPKQL